MFPKFDLVVDKSIYHDSHPKMRQQDICSKRLLIVFLFSLQLPNNTFVYPSASFRASYDFNLLGNVAELNLYCQETKCNVS